MWKDIRTEVERLTDGLGKPVDEGIIEAVTGLRALSFPTSASVQGHFEHGCHYPWIDIEIPDSKERPKTIEDKEDIERKRLQLEHRLLDLLEDFYSNRLVPYHVTLKYPAYAAELVSPKKCRRGSINNPRLGKMP